MKKLLLEYANIFAYTITGLVFGCAFFLLFINFYHMQELSETVDVSQYNDNNKASIESKVQTIKDNIGVYSQSTYRGNLSIYGLNNVQARLQNCIDIIESEEMMKYLELDEIGINDSYNFVVDYKNNILNDCLVMQVVSMLNTDTVQSLTNYNVISPLVESNVNIIIKNNVVIGGLIDAKEYSSLAVYDNCNFIGDTKILVSSNCEVIIRENTTSGSGLDIKCHPGYRIYIGKDCMFSQDIHLISGPGHSTFDLKSKKKLYLPDELTIKQKSIYIGP